MKRASLFFLATLCLWQPHALCADDAALLERAHALTERTQGKVFRDQVTPHWLPGNKSFWYRVTTAPNQHEFVLVDAESGTVKRANSSKELGLPDREHLSTSKNGSLEPKRTIHNGDETDITFHNKTAAAVNLFWINDAGEHKPYGDVAANSSRVMHTFAGHVWLLKDEAGAPLGYFEAAPEKLEIDIDGKPVVTKSEGEPEEARDAHLSPDKHWRISFKDKNILLAEDAGKSTAITEDGAGEDVYRGPVEWSPDSKHCVALFVHEVPRRKVTIVDSTPSGQLQPKLEQFDYQKPGDPLPQVWPVLIDAAAKTATVIRSDLFTNAFTPDGEMDVRWSPRGNEFYFDYNQRGHQVYRIVAVNATNGAARAVTEERSATFIDYTSKTWREWLDDSGEILWMSERDGWAHLWLSDVATGSVKNEITRGDWVVREVLRVDAAARQVWFLASGVRADEDPYHHQLCRVNFDGTGFLQLTQGDGDNAVEFSPDGKFFVARWSRVDQPTVTELRRSDNGKLICELERGDASRLVEAGWTMPERFAEKGRDGATDIYGVIFKPSNFDPKKKYPVVQQIYAGPHDAFAPVKFGRYTLQHEIAELGFIVVQIDGMGTNHRGKKFHDVCWKNLKDAGFPDDIEWLNAAAKTRGWMDLSRMGIYGGSAGGQSAMRALLDHNDFYKVAVADCGCHDNRMDKIWWNEQWMGWPIDESYARNSNAVDAHKLKGDLLLMVGELDHNVDPASTMQVVSALEKANKDFDFVIMAGAGHGSAETPYGSKRRAEFLIDHLLGANRH